MPHVIITGWNSAKAWAGHSSFTRNIVGGRLARVSTFRGMDLKRLVRDMVRRHCVTIPIKPNTDTQTFESFLQSQGAEFEISEKENVQRFQVKHATKRR
jgi:hypothetical protein